VPRQTLSRLAFSSSTVDSAALSCETANRRCVPVSLNVPATVDHNIW